MNLMVAVGARSLPARLGSMTEDGVLYVIAADAILLTHALFVGFVVFGLVFILVGKLRSWAWVRNPWFRYAHLAGIGFVVLQSWLGAICPLTTWEMALREKAGGAVYSGTFVAHWLESVLYYRVPEWVFIVCYTVFGVLVAVTWYWVRPRRFIRGARATALKIDDEKEDDDMPAHKPEECDLLLFKVIETGNLDAALALYEPDAIFVVPPDQIVTGHAAIRKVLQGMIAANATGKLDAVSAVQSADGSVAFTRATGSSTAPGPDGKPVTTYFHSIEIVRKQQDGTWRIIIDDPSGKGLA